MKTALQLYTLLIVCFLLDLVNPRGPFRKTKVEQRIPIIGNNGAQGTGPFN